MQAISVVISAPGPSEPSDTLPEPNAPLDQYQKLPISLDTQNSSHARSPDAVYITPKIQINTDRHSNLARIFT